MLLVLFAALSLWAVDTPRLLPVMPEAVKPFMETGNRAARRRMAKVGY